MDATTDWWTEFFYGPFGDLQLDGAMSERTRGEVDGIEQKLKITRARILDAPCGTGRHALELARRGHGVVAIDFNPKVLDAARATAREAALEIEFRCEDLRGLSDAGPYDAALCLWGSFGYFSEQENARHVAAVARALRPGGMFFLDLPVSETVLPNFRTHDWSWWGAGERRVRVLEERSFNVATSRIDVIWTFQRAGSESSHQTSIRVYGYAELIRLLEQAGFSDFDARSRDGTPFRIGSRLWLAATKGSVA